jgi:hypothetical protein
MRLPFEDIAPVAVTRLAVACVVAIAGCTEPTGPRTVANPDIAVKVPAIKEAVETKDADAAPQLVKDLESDDPAVRFYAIGGLRRLTGQDFGYQYFADRECRQPAVEKWQQWLNGRPQP